MKNTTDKFIPLLKEYFTIYLPKQRSSSKNTITAHYQVWGMLLKYICCLQKIKPEDITFANLRRPTIVSFLDDMEKERAWTANTKNHRLGCIRSFFRYVSYMDPLLVIYLNELQSIPLKKGIDKSYVVDFLSQDAMKLILQQPDTTKKKGIRDAFFMALLYDSAARDCEMLRIRLSDINPENGTVYLLGKGNKPRIVSINSNTVQQLIRYMKIYHMNSNQTDFLFYTIHQNEKTPMSDDNVGKFIRKYGIQAQQENNEIPNNVHPHLFRHSRAMHLYRAGMPLELLAQFLGHEDPKTSLIYAYADTEMKRNAIEKAESFGTPLIPPAEKGIWEGDEDIIRRLCNMK
jgi:site-specific recombinase XerD